MLLALLATPVAAQDADPYPDTPADAWYAPAVGALASDGVFAGTGCDAGFCPDEAMDRATMAVWVVRVLDGADPAPVGSTRFADVDADHRHRAFIERLAELGVTSGCRDGTVFCPGGTVTRAQMAVFLARAFDLPEGPDPGFDDVAADAWYASDVAKLAASGVTSGCRDGTVFCPGGTVTRAQMAVFLARALGLTTTPATQPRIAYTVYDPDTRGFALYVTNADGSDTIKITDGGLNPVWSPDGTRIAYRRDAREWTGVQYIGDSGLYVTNADGTDTTKITDTAGGWRWSPDGTRIAYRYRDPDTRGFALYVADADGTGTTKITDGGLNPVWSPDGTRIAYRRDAREWTGVQYIDYGGDSGLYVADADGTDTTKITDWGLNPVWSPDGTRIAYDNHEGLHVADADGTGTIKITDWGLNPVWSPDGTRIAYADDDPRIDYDRQYTGSAIYVADADGTDTTKVIDSALAAVWSPDGTRIAYVHEGLYVADADGTDTIKITDTATWWRPWADGDDPTDSGPLLVWSPDGTRIAYSGHSQSPDFQGLYVANADGTVITKVTEMVRPAPVRSPWSPDATRIAYFDEALYVADADGANAIKITDTAGFVRWLGWSPS